MCCHVQLLSGCRDLNLGPHISTAITLSGENIPSYTSLFTRLYGKPREYVLEMKTDHCDKYPLSVLSLRQWHGTPGSPLGTLVCCLPYWAIHPTPVNTGLLWGSLPVRDTASVRGSRPRTHALPGDQIQPECSSPLEKEDSGFPPPH